MHYSVRGIINIEDGIVLIHRIKKRNDGSFREYYVVPGGKMEQDETQEQTVVREIKEELGIEVKPVKKILEYYSEYDDSIQCFYECEYINGDIGTGNGPEMHRKSPLKNNSII